MLYKVAGLASKVRDRNAEVWQLSSSTFLCVFIMLYNVALTFESVYKRNKSEHLDASYRAV